MEDDKECPHTFNIFYFVHIVNNQLEDYFTYKNESKKIIKKKKDFFHLRLLFSRKSGIYINT